MENLNFIQDDLLDRPIRADKDPLHRYFSWESLSPGDHLYQYRNNATAKTGIESVIRMLSMNGLEQRKYLTPSNPSEAYIANWNYLKNNAKPLGEARANANPTGLTIEQILKQDRHFHRTYVNNNIYAQMMSSNGCTSFMSGSKAWELKHHKLTNYGWPRFSHNFQDLGAINVGPEGVKSVGYGWGTKWDIPWTVMDQAAGGIYDPDYWLLFMNSQQMGIFGDERGFLGGAGENTTGKGAPNLTGIHNTSGAATVQLGLGNDDDMANGKEDFDDMFIMMLQSMNSNAIYGTSKRVFVSTSGLACETLDNDSAVGDLKTLYQQIQDKWFKSGIIDEWYIDNNIEADTNATNTQRAMLLALSPNYIKRTIVYPLQRKARLDKTYSDDLAFAYITGDILQVYDANAIVNGDADLTTTYAGFLPNQLFMTANSNGPQNMQAPRSGSSSGMNLTP